MRTQKNPDGPRTLIGVHAHRMDIHKSSHHVDPLQMIGIMDPSILLREVFCQISEMQNIAYTSRLKLIRHSRSHLNHWRNALNHFCS